VRKITNSAGRTGAMPILPINRPLSMSSYVMIISSRSQRDQANGKIDVRRRQALRHYQLSDQRAPGLSLLRGRGCGVLASRGDFRADSFSLRIGRCEEGLDCCIDRLMIP
jgi:hypothetical protein